MPLRRQAYASGIRLNAGLQAVRKQVLQSHQQRATVYVRVVTDGRRKTREETSSREDAKRFGQRYIRALNMQCVQREAIGESIV